MSSAHVSAPVSTVHVQERVAPYYRHQPKASLREAAGKG